MSKTICFGILAVLCLKPVFGEETILRIKELIPDSWVEYPAIEPAIPADYVLKEIEETACALWGTKEDVAILFEDESKITSEVVALRHCWDIVQTGPMSFSQESELEEGFKQIGCKNIEIKKVSWGNYPVLAVACEGPDGNAIHLAWIGLNSPNGGVTIQMNLFLPKNGDRSYPVWKNLLSQTRELEEPEFFRAMGMNMKDGYTIYTSGTASLKITAEKRISDNLLAVIVEPLSPNTTFEIEDINELPMITNWKNGEPCAKIYGTMTETEGKFGTCIEDSKISVLTKKVETFSFDLDNHPEGAVIFKKVIKV